MSIQLPFHRRSQEKTDVRKCCRTRTTLERSLVSFAPLLKRWFEVTLRSSSSLFLAQPHRTCTKSIPAVHPFMLALSSHTPARSCTADRCSTPPTHRLRFSTRCGLHTLPLPAPPSDLSMHQLASDRTPTSPYANMSIPSYSFFDRQEADELSQLNQRNYQCLADSVGFDSVVLKQRESDKAILAKERGVAVSSSTSSSNQK